jgi:hypothetical protein
MERERAAVRELPTSAHRPDTQAASAGSPWLSSAGRRGSSIGGLLDSACTPARYKQSRMPPAGFAATEFKAGRVWRSSLEHMFMDRAPSSGSAAGGGGGGEGGSSGACGATPAHCASARRSSVQAAASARVLIIASCRGAGGGSCRSAGAPAARAHASRGRRSRGRTGAPARTRRTASAGLLHRPANGQAAGAPPASRALTTASRCQASRRSL